MLQKELTKEQVLQAGDQILHYMEEPSIERGYQHFARGSIYNIRVREGNLLTSEVQDTAVYQVEMHLEDLPKSSCTCPYTHLCEHLAATYFQTYSVFDNPKIFLQKVQKPRTIHFSPSLLEPPKLVRSKSAFTQALTQSMSTLSETTTVQEWAVFLSNWTRNLSMEIDRHRLLTELRNNFDRALMVTYEWREVRAKLFAIHAILFHLHKLHDFAAYIPSNSSTSWSQELRRTADRFIEQLEGIVYELDCSQLNKDDQLTLVSLLAFAKKMVQEDCVVINWVVVTQMMWWYLLDSEEHHREAAQVTYALADPMLSKSNQDTYRLLQTHFAVVEGDDLAALQVWKQNGYTALPTFLFYLKAIARRNEWHRLLGWFDGMECMIVLAEGQDYRLITGVWQHALEREGRMNQWGDILKQLLPRSFHEYSVQLFNQNKWKLWIDLHMSYKTPYTDIQDSYEKQLEAAHPNLLVPLYTREINRVIQLRNRTAYKEAIKLLKKVRSFYKEANQEDRWSLYLTRLADKYNRLRAFQEELKRGNLLS